MGVFRDLTGQTFNRLSVLSLGGKVGKHILWRVKCLCGTETEVDAYALSHGKTKSCGCLQREELGHRSKAPEFVSLFKALCNSAKHAETSLEMTFEQFKHIAESEPKCHYCERELLWCKNRVKGKPFGYNLDRMDNTKGYSVENCVPCCSECNNIKKCRTYGEARVMVTALMQYRREQNLI